MKLFFIAYAAAVVAFLVIDGLWLGLVAKGFYARHLGFLLRENFLVLPAAAFYLLYTAGLVVLAVRPFESPSMLQVAAYGALVGLLAYGTYDITNLATVKDWPVIVTVVDIAWGTVLSATVAVASAWFLRTVTSH